MWCWNILIIKGQFWERMELYDVFKIWFFISFFIFFLFQNNQKVPFDLQELNVIVSSTLKSNQIQLIADTKNYVLTSRETKRTFIDQQKW